MLPDHGKFGVLALVPWAFPQMSETVVCHAAMSPNSEARQELKSSYGDSENAERQ